MRVGTTSGLAEVSVYDWFFLANICGRFQALRGSKHDTGFWFNNMEQSAAGNEVDCNNTRTVLKPAENGNVSSQLGAYYTSAQPS